MDYSIPNENILSRFCRFVIISDKPYHAKRIRTLEMTENFSWQNAHLEIAAKFPRSLPTSVKAATTSSRCSSSCRTILTTLHSGTSCLASLTRSTHPHLTVKVMNKLWWVNEDLRTGTMFMNCDSQLCMGNVERNSEGLKTRSSGGRSTLAILGMEGRVMRKTFFRK